MGLSPSKSKTKTSSSSTATTTPQVPSWLSQPYQDYVGQVNQWSQQGPSMFGPSGLQQQAFAGASGLNGSGSQNVTDAASATRDLMGYNPQAVSAESAADYMGRYQNPWENEVVARSLADQQEFYNKAISQGQGAATQAGAYGGSRHGVADSLTAASSIKSAGDLAAQLRAAGFNTALSAGQQDAGRAQEASQFNSTMGMTGQQFRAQLAQQLGQLGLSGDANARANLGLMSELGEQERNIAMQNDPHNAQGMQLAQLMALLAGANPELFTGQTGTQTGTSTTTTPTGGWLAQLGSMFQGMGNMGISFNAGGKG